MIPEYMQDEKGKPCLKGGCAMRMKDKMGKMICLVLFGSFILYSLTGCSSLGNAFHWAKFWDSNTTNSHRLTERDLAQFASTMRPARGNPDSYYLLACYYQGRGRHIEAIEEFKKVVLIDPNYVKAYNGMGVSYDLTGDFPRAVECYQKALELNPNSGYVQNNLGYSYLLQGKPDEAIAAFTKAIALNDQERRFHNNLGLAYAMKDQFDLAMAEFKLAGDEGKAHFNIAQLYYKKGLYREAKSNYAKALTLDPSYTRAQTGLEAAEAMARISPQPVVVAEAKKEVLIAPEQPSLLSKEEPEVLTPPSLVSLTPEPLKSQEPASENREVVYDLQVASTRSPQNANLVAKSLQRSGYKASVRNWKDEEGEEWNRIIIGSFTNKEEALTFKQKIEKEYDYKPVIVQSTTVKTGPEKLDIQEQGADREQLSSLKEIKVEISNGNGVRRMARRVGNYLKQNGVRVVRLTNANNFRYRNTKIYYLEGYSEAANHVADQIPGIQDVKMVKTFDRPNIRVKVLIGKDLIPYHKAFAASRVKFANFHGSHKKIVQVVMK
jgi:tetratricopeptide (TPR) repeat protein